MALEENEIEKGQWSQWWYFDFMISPLTTLSKRWVLWVVFAWLALIVAVFTVALIFVSPSISWWVDSYNDVEKLKIEKWYELQLKTYALISWEVLHKIDAIETRMTTLEKRFDAIDKRNSSLEERVNRIENWMQRLYQSLELKTPRY